MRVEHFGDAALYLGSNRDILPTLNHVHAIITDPPYGINLKYNSYDDTEEAWFDLMQWLVSLAKIKSDITIFPCCRIKSLEWIYKNVPPDWLMCWYKGSPGHRAYTGFNDWEPHLVYGKRSGTQFHDYFFAPPTDVNLDVDHPCPKSLAWGQRLISIATLQNDVVLDPYLGSGTTGVAALSLNRKFIGIEIDQKYFDIACRRIENAAKQPTLF